MNDLKTLSGSFENTLKSSDLNNIAADFSEVALDQMIADGAFKDLPIIGTIVNIGKATTSVRDYLFLKKVIGFLTTLEGIPTKDRKEMIEKIDSSGKFRIKVGEKLLFLIDKCQDHEKAKVVARLFAAVIKEEISYKNYLSAVNIIENITIEQLDWFVKTDVMRQRNHEYVVQLMHTGLFGYDIIITKGQRNEDGSLKRASIGSDSFSELIPFVYPIGAMIKKSLK